MEKPTVEELKQFAWRAGKEFYNDIFFRRDLRSPFGTLIPRDEGQIQGWIDSYWCQKNQEEDR